jgi:hypothetical protein
MFSRKERLPRGNLSVHEEFANATVEAITPFLRETFHSAAMA